MINLNAWQGLTSGCNEFCVYHSPWARKRRLLNQQTSPNLWLVYCCHFNVSKSDRFTPKKLEIGSKNRAKNQYRCSAALSESRSFSFSDSEASENIQNGSPTTIVQTDELTLFKGRYNATIGWKAFQFHFLFYFLVLWRDFYRRFPVIAPRHHPEL